MASESPSTVRKVVIHLRATGDAPILKQQKFKVSGTDRFASVIDFLCRQLHRDTLFVYINSAFSPNPDESVIDLYNFCREWFGLDVSDLRIESASEPFTTTITSVQLQ